MTPNVALALEDFVPVFLTMVALIWLTRLVFQMNQRSGQIALIGSTLVVLGGLFKASEKLIWALSGDRVMWMNDSLFLLMAPGFALLAWGIWSGQRTLFTENQPRFLWQTPMAFIFFVGGGSIVSFGSEMSRSWFLILLTLVVIMSSIMLVLLNRHARRYHLNGVARLFLLYLALTLVLNGLARIPSTTIGAEWTKQLINTGAAALLAFASWRLWVGVQRASKEVDPDLPPIFLPE